MSHKKRKQVTPSDTHYLLNIPLDHLHPDPHQPRTYFDEEELGELAQSIGSQGLLQPPSVNFAFMRDGERHFYLKTGERRYHAHHRLGKEVMRCIVEPATYDGVRNTRRRLSQAAENSSRVPHQHREIVELLKDLIAEEVANREGKTHGALQPALIRLAEAFGRSQEWAKNYAALTHLHPELLGMLDSKNDDERLNFSVGKALSRISLEGQHAILEEAKPLKEKGGHSLMHRFIVRKARELQEDRGIPIRGPRPSDDRIIFERAVDGFYRQALSFYAERPKAEYKAYVRKILAQMSGLQVDSVLLKMKETLVTFTELLELIQERRDQHYERQGLRVVKG